MVSTVTYLRTSLYGVLDKSNTYSPCNASMANCSTIMVLSTPFALYDDPLPAKAEADNSVELLEQPALYKNK